MASDLWWHFIKDFIQMINKHAKLYLISSLAPETELQPQGDTTKYSPKYLKSIKQANRKIPATWSNENTCDTAGRNINWLPSL